jgi:Spy/CpxP family protein refolding chaperone
MNRTITQQLAISFALTLLLGSGALLAQTDEQIEQFNKDRHTYFNEKLELTAAEQKAFWPLYDDFQHRKMKITEDQRNTFRYSHQNAENLSNEEINENLEKIQRLKDELNQLEKEYYYKKFPEVLPPKKVLNLYKVEWDFRHYLIKEIRGKGPQDGKGGGPGRGDRGEMPMVPSPF